MNKQALTLSIIIPVYNEEGYLKKCLEAIEKQTQAPDQVIVVDNNSTDSSVEIAQQFSFVTVLHEKEQGVIHTRNTGFNAATGHIIGRIDADTILEPHWCEQVRKIFEDKHIGAVTGPVKYYDMPLERVGYHLDNLIRKTIKKTSDNFPFLFGTNMAIRNSIWKAYKDDFCTTKDVHEDLDIAIHLYKAKVRIAYRQNMVAGMSARRYDDSPRRFYAYLLYFRTTFEKHKIKTNTSHFAMVTFMIGYFFLKPFRWLYDPKTGRYSLVQLLHPKRARRHPMG